MVLTCRRKDLSWKEFFQDSALLCKNSFVPSVFALEPVVDGYLDPPWVHEEIQRNHASSPPSSRKKEKHHQSKEDASEQFKFVALLNCCAERRDLHEGARLHMDIIKRRFILERSPHLVSSLISMYAKCGDLPSAEELLEKLPMRGTSSWNALIGGYIQQARTYEALDSFERMKNEGTPSNVVTFTCVLKACGKLGFLRKGIEIHDEIVMKGLLDKDVMLGNALVDMYARCGMVGSAQEALEMLPIRDVISWSALISGYVQKGHGQEALDCFEQMQCEGLSPNEITFVCSLKACGSIIAIETGKEIHGEVLSRGLLEKNIMLSTALVDMYAKCGMLAEALQVHEGFLVQNTVSWSALISGYVEMGQVCETLKLFEQMQTEGITPDSVTFISILKICSECFNGAINKGREIHSKIVTEGLLVQDILLGNALLDMYVKCRMFIEAQTVLEELSVRDIVTWSTLIAGYTEEDHAEEALKCFDLMLSEGLSPNAVTLLCCLKACGIRRDLEKGKQIHDEIVGGCFLEKDIVLGTALVDMYVKCGVLCKAQGVLDSLPVRDTVSWSAIIKGYSEQGQYHEALSCFSRLQSEGLSPDAITFICILNVYGILGSLDKGKEIHEMIVTMGLLERNDIILANALASMYSKCGILEKTEQVLEELPSRDVASWNTLISGYVQQGQNEKALSCYERIQNDCLSPDTVTFMCMLKACGSIGALTKGKQIHSEIVRIGLLNKETVLRNALVDMYAKCGMLEKARHLVEGLSIRDIIAWNSLIGGYTQQGQCEEALNTFEQLQREGLLPDAVTFTCILKACSSIGVIERGKRIHDKVSRAHSLKKDPVLGTTLVNMYAKCGLLSKAREVLEELHTRDIVSWNALLWGYAQQQQGLDLMKCVECLQYEGLSPNEVTFVCALSACGRSGLLSEAEILFSCMTVAPRLEHNSCMAVTFGRAGYFERAATLFKGVSTSAKAAIWFAILSACRRWGYMRLGRLAFDQTIQPNDCDPLVSIDLVDSMKDVNLLASNYDSNNSDAVYAFSCYRNRIFRSNNKCMFNAECHQTKMV